MEQVKQALMNLNIESNNDKKNINNINNDIIDINEIDNNFINSENVDLLDKEEEEYKNNSGDNFENGGKF